MGNKHKNKCRVRKEVGTAILKSYGGMNQVFLFLPAIEVILCQGLCWFMYKIGVGRCQVAHTFGYVYFTDFRKFQSTLFHVSKAGKMAQPRFYDGFKFYDKRSVQDRSSLITY